MKLGRKPRLFDPSIPHYSALVAGRRRSLAPPPATVDHITPCSTTDFGMMGNDRLGDCTCAAVGHSRQIWSGNANPPMQTDVDANIIELYQDACQYNPADPSTDQGGDEQSVLKYWMNQGLPLDADTVDRLSGFVEVDPENITDIKSAIWQAGVAYIGFNVPDFAMQTVGQLWDVRPGTPSFVGGHAVILAKYEPDGPTCITWGKPQKMTWAFFSAFTDEAYAPIDMDWIMSTGKTPAGMSLDELQAAMSAIKKGWL